MNVAKDGKQQTYQSTSGTYQSASRESGTSEADNRCTCSQKEKTIHRTFVGFEAFFASFLESFEAFFESFLGGLRDSIETRMRREHAADTMLNASGSVPVPPGSHREPIQKSFKTFKKTFKMTCKTDKHCVNGFLFL